MSEIKISYAQFDKAVEKIDSLKNRCSNLKCDISISSTGDCAKYLKEEATAINDIKDIMLHLLSTTEDFLKNAKSEFKNMDQSISDKISEE